MVEHQTIRSRFWGHIPSPDDHGYPRGVGVVFCKDPGQLESRSVSVSHPKCVELILYGFEPFSVIDVITKFLAGFSPHINKNKDLEILYGKIMLEPDIFLFLLKN